MTQPTLFQLTPPPTVPPVAEIPRQRQRERAFAHADKLWADAYAVFIVEWLTANGPAIAETIRLKYESRRDLPQLVTASKRASGQLFVSLVKAGKIERYGSGTAKDGSGRLMPAYRVKGLA